MKEKLVKDENYITIQGWMSSKLGLKGNELILFAMIYGFCQIEGHKFNGSLQYMVDWTNSTKQSCINNLKSLLDKELIIKEELDVNGIKYCTYSINFNTIQKILIPIQKILTNNIDNKIDINNINIINKENLEKNDKEPTFSDIDAEITKNQKNKKSKQKIQNAILINNMLENFTANEEVKNYLKEYLEVRRKKGLTPDQWKIILDDLRKECRTDKDYAVEKIKKAIAGGWMQIIYKPKSKFSSKPKFDNTANHQIPKELVNMTDSEKEDFIKNELAYDENGNLLKF